MLENLEPKKVMFYFEEVSKIPRGSGNEKAISDYIVNFAKEHSLECVQDEALNAIVKKGATIETAETLILQAHMDMVCEKNKNVNHDFINEPIFLKVDGDFIKADGTTLGADNGIGVAYMLAILASDDIIHPNLECVFTSDEEQGMTGAKALDLSQLKGKMVINIDSDEEGIITVGCAGGARVSIDVELSYEQQSTGSKTYEITIKGLQGGHSGTEINKNRGNANKLLGKLLNRLELAELPYNISHINGGMKANAIPREACTHIIIDSKLEAEFLKSIDVIKCNIKEENIENEKNISIIIEESVVKNDKMFDLKTTKAIVNILAEVFNGVYSMSADVDGLVESSSNIGVIEQTNNSVEFKILPRSSKPERLEEIIKNMERLVGEYDNVSILVDSHYPAWDYEKNSMLREISVEAYKKTYKENPSVNIVHAGLECAIFKENRRDLDLISIGATAYDIHTPDERVSISSVQRTWEYLKEILKNIK